MSYIHFDKDSMVNLSYSLNKELLRTNKEGGYGSTTLIGCNTSRYHGLLVVPQPTIDGDNHVLLSSLEESVIQHGEEFQLSVHQYNDDYFYPKGHKYINEVTCDPIPSITYCVGGVVLKKERINSSIGFRMMVRYTLIDAHSATTLKIRPLLAFRNRHVLTHCNNDVDTNYEVIRNGIRCRMYPNYSFLNIQLNKSNEYQHAPDWYYNFEYAKDRERGYDYHEDLYTPGYFLVNMQVGQSIIISIATEESNPTTLTRLFNSEVARRIPRDSFKGCLLNAAQQFIIRENGSYKVIAGYPWLGVIPRDTFLALPGLTLTQGKPDIFRNVIDGMIKDMNGPFFNFYNNIHSAPVPSADASLWLLWCLNQYADKVQDGKKFVWRHWGKTIKKILTAYRDGTDNEIYANEDGLLHQGRHGLALTWMNSIVNSKPVSPRTGYAVEINALWYNAICFAVDLATTCNDKTFVKEWGDYAEKVGKSFVKEFWDEDKGYLCDYFEAGEEKNWKIRPNMLIAIGLQHSPLDYLQKSKIFNIVNDELRTAHGIRTLSPRHEEFVPVCSGDHNTRGLTMHQGSAYPWLLMFYAEYIKMTLDKERAVSYFKKIISDFESEMMEDGIGTLSQMYDGNPPYTGRGTISHATSVAALLLIADNLD